MGLNGAGWCTSIGRLLLLLPKEKEKRLAVEAD